MVGVVTTVVVTAAVVVITAVVVTTVAETPPLQHPRGRVKIAGTHAQGGAKRAMKYAGAPTIMLTCLASACLCEAILWVLMYRHSSYQKLVETISRTSKKVESLKESGAKDKGSKGKKLGRQEQYLKQTARELHTAKMKSQLFVMFTLMGLFAIMSNLYSGTVVARLPFKPFGPIRQVSSRGLTTDDPLDCSMAFIYLLCSMTFRSNVQKALGFAPPRAIANMNNPWANMQNQMQQ